MSSPTVIDLFCGTGGASLGFLQAGYDVVGAVDAERTALDTYKRNLCHGETDDFPGSVRFDEPLQADLSRGYTDEDVDDELTTVTFADIREHFGFATGEVDVICGCPPCQNFSSLRDTEPWPDNKPKDSHLRAFVEFIEESVPDVVFFENVRNIMTAGEEKSSTYVDWLLRSMSEVTRPGDTTDNGGYGAALGVLNAADYGVPQRRKRTIGLFVYGSDDDAVSLPDPTHAEAPVEDADLKEWVTVAETFEQYEDTVKRNLDRGEQQVGLSEYPDDPAHRARNHHQSTVDRMKAIRDHGWGWRDLLGTDDEDHIVDAHKNLDRGADSAYGIIDPSSPAPTLTTRCTTPSCGRFTHPEMNRALTYREAALLMTFPRDFKLPKKNDAAERIVGNAVPPRLVKHIGDEIRQHIQPRELRQ